MNKNLEELKQEFFDVKNEGMLKYIIPVLEDFEKRVKRLEQAQTYSPLEYPNQTGGIDNIKITPSGRL